MKALILVDLCVNGSGYLLLTVQIGPSSKTGHITDSGTFCTTMRYLCGDKNNGIELCTWIIYIKHNEITHDSFTEIKQSIRVFLVACKASSSFVLSILMQLPTTNVTAWLSTDSRSNLLCTGSSFVMWV